MPPSSLASASPLPEDERIATLWPSCASRRAAAAPIPLPAAVTIATFIGQLQIFSWDDVAKFVGPAATFNRRCTKSSNRLSHRHRPRLPSRFLIICHLSLPAGGSPVPYHVFLSKNADGV